MLRIRLCCLLVLATYGAAICRAEATLKERCAAVADELRKEIGSDFPVIVREPFVISGNLSERDLDRWYDRTLKPATEAMLASYFDREPNRPITVLLYDSADVYDAEAKRLFGDEGLSPYGYYKPNRRTLVMNIATGGGTLVHELTHALIDFDFPDVPAWFNEGLASLHEQCQFREDGSGIDGLENWRLPALQEAIKKNKLRSLESLIHDDDFRTRNVGMNYAQARYFCLYLQREGLLEKYYETFRDNHKKDPTGELAVRKVFPNSSWAELDKAYQDWVLTLQAP